MWAGAGNVSTVYTDTHLYAHAFVCDCMYLCVYIHVYLYNYKYRESTLSGYTPKPLSDIITPER